MQLRQRIRQNDAPHNSEDQLSLPHVDKRRTPTWRQGCIINTHPSFDLTAVVQKRVIWHCLQRSKWNEPHSPVLVKHVDTGSVVPHNLPVLGRPCNAR